MPDLPSILFKRLKSPDNYDLFLLYKGGSIAIKYKRTHLRKNDSYKAMNLFLKAYSDMGCTYSETGICFYNVMSFFWERE